MKSSQWHWSMIALLSGWLSGASVSGSALDAGERAPYCSDDLAEEPCPPVRDSRLGGRVVPTGDAIGTPLHHLNFSGDCYGENWRTQNWWCYPSRSARFHQRTHSHSLGMERCWNQLFGKLPRGYIHDTSGHPLRSYFVTQSSEPELEYVPGSDTLTPPRMVMDYANYAYPPGRNIGSACDSRSEPAGRSRVIPASASR